MKTKHILMTILLTLILISTIHATNTTADQTQIQVNNHEQLTHTIENQEQKQTTIQLNEGNYNKFQVNMTKTGKELTINGNNQTITGNIEINVAKNTKLTINSLTLNHTGKTQAKIINNGLLCLNNVQLTNKYKTGLNADYLCDYNVVDSLYDTEGDTYHEPFIQKRSIINKETPTNASGINITNNYKLIINNSTIINNTISGATITNNYITHINNTIFENNYAHEEFANNGKLLINNTKIDKDNLFHIINSEKENQKIKPEVTITNSKIIYNPLDNWVINNVFDSKVIIINTTFSKVIAPYFVEEHRQLFLDGVSPQVYLANNTIIGKDSIDKEINFIGINNHYTDISTNKTCNTWELQYNPALGKYINQPANIKNNKIQEALTEFLTYYDDTKQIPLINVYYEAKETKLCINITDTQNNQLTGKIQILLTKDDETIKNNYNYNKKLEIKYPDYTINKIDELNITFNTNQDYITTTRSYKNYPIYSDEDTAIYKNRGNIIPGLQYSEMWGSYDGIIVKPGETISTQYEILDENSSYVNPKNGKILINFLNNETIINMTKNPQNIKINIPETITNGTYDCTATFIHPNYIPSQSIMEVIINDETNNKPKNSINISTDIEKTTSPLTQDNKNKNIQIKNKQDTNIIKHKTQHYQTQKITRNKSLNKYYRQGTIITINTINKIFAHDFTNQTIQIYLDGKLVFNGTLTDNLSEVLFNITGEYEGYTTLKIVTNNKTYSKKINIL
ncbi:MAG: hypothetical protein IJI98_10650 [Methanosphaera sp.]|nr:hypothetical protein [Methanosphaera sp.]